MDINTRLEKLERENRRMKKIGIVAAVLLSTFIIGGQTETISHRLWNNPEVSSTM